MKGVLRAMLAIAVVATASCTSVASPNGQGKPPPGPLPASSFTSPTQRASSLAVASSSAGENCSEEKTLYRNDDGSSGAEPIGFTIDYYGEQFSQLFVNNNGNVTFDQALSTYVPFDLRDTDRKIIAPFFADVDTRPANGGTVTYGPGTFEGHQAFCVRWNVVGYYSNGTDRLNTFSMWIVNRSDRRAGDFDIAFRYDRIEWETGSASGGVTAHAGFSAGTGNPSQSLELQGSGVPGGFMDGDPEGLVHRQTNSPYDRIFVFRLEGGGFCAVASTCPVATVHALEVTQSIQDLNNSVPLVQNRSTMVRAYVSADRTTSVRARLRGYGADRRELAESPIGIFDASSHVLGTENPIPNRADASASINFLVPKSWTQQSNLRLVLEIPGSVLNCAERDTRKDCAVDVTLFPTSKLHIRTFTTSYLGSGKVDYGPALERAQRAQSIMPVSELDWSTGSVSVGTAWCTVRSGSVCATDFLNALQRKRSAECSAPCDTFYLGLTGASFGEGDGLNGQAWGIGDSNSPLSTNPGVAVARVRSTDPNAIEALDARNAAPHELGHTVGLGHSVPAGASSGSCGEFPAPGAPTHPYYQTINGRNVAVLGPTSPDESRIFGVDVRQLWRGHPELLISSPDDTYALMSYCGRQTGVPHGKQGRWASLDEYSVFLSKFAPSAPRVLRQMTSAEGPELHIVLDSSSDIVEQATLFLGAVPASPAGDYAVVLRGSGGTAVASYPFDPTAGEEEGTPLPRSADVPLPDLDASVEAIDVTGPRGTVLKTIPVSAHAPTVQATATVADDHVNVVWTAEDADGDPLSYDVSYLDSAGHWSPVALGLTGTTFSVPIAELDVEPTTRFRVVVSDVSHLTEAETDDLGLPGVAPEILIDSPTDGASFTDEMPVVLNATAVQRTRDVSDSIEWRSSIDGPLGTGSQVFTSASKLTPGRHTITASIPGESPSSARSLVINIGAPSPPNAPEALHLDPTSDGFAATWAPPLGPVTPTGYHLSVTPGSLSVDLAPYQVSYPITGLAPGTYTVSLTALAGTLEGPASTQVGVVGSPLNGPPTALPQVVSGRTGVPIPIVLSGTDPDGDPLTYRISNPPSHGSLSGDAPALVYTSAAGYIGADEFSFTVSDGKHPAVEATVSVAVTGADQPDHIEVKVTGARNWNASGDLDPASFRVERASDGGLQRLTGSGLTASAAVPVLAVNAEVNRFLGLTFGSLTVRRVDTGKSVLSVVVEGPVPLVESEGGATTVRLVGYSFSFYRWRPVVTRVELEVTDSALVGP